MLGSRACLLALATAFVTACAPVRAPPTPRAGKDGPHRWQWDVSFAEGVDDARVRLCWEGGVPRRFVPNTPTIDDAVSDVVRLPGEEPLEHEGTAWLLEGGTVAGCIRYDVAVGWIALTRQDIDVALAVGDDRILGADLLFLRPDPALTSDGGRARFHLPDELEVSVPFPPDPDAAPLVVTAGFEPGMVDEGRLYRVPRSAFTKNGHLAVGRFDVRALPVAGGVLELALLDTGVEVPESVLARWIFEAGRAVSHLYGTLPRERVQVLVGSPPFPTGRGPVLFGLATRGGGPSVSLLVDKWAEEDGLIGEWIAVHELAHHGLPFIAKEDQWLSEGMATYYQTVLRARAGFLSEADAYSDFLEGSGSAERGRRGSYRWIYWSGAMGALRVDAELRAASGGALSLDEALHRMRGRVDLDEQRSADEAVALLDEVTGTGHFTAWRERRRTDAFVAWRDVLGRLGVTEGPGGRAVLDDDAEWAAIRRAIVQPVLPAVLP